MISGYFPSVGHFDDCEGFFLHDGEADRDGRVSVNTGTHEKRPSFGLNVLWSDTVSLGFDHVQAPSSTKDTSLKSW